MKKKKKKKVVVDREGFYRVGALHSCGWWAREHESDGV